MRNLSVSLSDTSFFADPRPAPHLVSPADPEKSRESTRTPPVLRAAAWPANAPRADVPGLHPHELAVIDAALAILAQRFVEPGAVLDHPAAVREYLRLHLAGLDREVFGVLFLDAQHRVIVFEPMFRGTLTQTSVYPREVARRALAVNAAAVILTHNHPSGTAEPSRADEFLTQAMKAALATVDVRVLDHLVIGWPDVVSFAERGLMSEPPRHESAKGARARRQSSAAPSNATTAP